MEGILSAAYQLNYGIYHDVVLKALAHSHSFEQRVVNYNVSGLVSSVMRQVSPFSSPTHVKR